MTTGTVRHAKLQSNHHHQQTNCELVTGRLLFLSSNQHCQSTEGKYTISEPELLIVAAVVVHMSLT